jgi:hypothetical protein
VRRLEAGQKGVVRQVRRRREEWSVLILNHHEGYIDWDVYESNQKVITDNENARGGAVRGPIKRSPAGWTAALWSLWRQVAGAISPSTRDSVSVLGVHPQS